MKTPAPGRRRARVSRYAGHEGGDGPVSERNAAVSGRRKTPPPSVTAPQGGGRETAYRGLSPGIGATMQGGGSIAALVFGVQGRRKNPKFPVSARRRQGGGETPPLLSGPREEEGP